ncbi:hypothetical protein [Methylobacterium sp. 77]|uniref:hypothetical protein n=1 Tax=Methylobacterium sp. 77 TaxID=1101192 RepID=UPI0012DCF101|nr:hypothetical protein [Methylobacterium sp. 77]
MDNITKPIIMAAIAFGSVFYMSGNLNISIASAFVPLILSMMGVVQSLGYAFSAICLILSVFWFASPEETREKVRSEVERIALKS